MNQYETDILIIGAGQAGLALAYYLQSTDLRYLLIEQNERIGDSWRQRYDSLTLFTSRAYSALPGLAVKGDPDGYATRDEIASYFEHYAHHYDFPIHLKQSVEQLKKTQHGFQATTITGDIYLSHIVVIATGAFQKASVPQMANHFAPDVNQFTAQTYQNPAQIPIGKVLIVGDGASGRDFANELSQTHDVLLATGRSRRLLPEKLLGKSVWWWLDRLNLLQARKDSFIGKLMQKTDPFPARGRRLKSLEKKGVRILPHLTKVEGDIAHFDNGHSAQVDVVIWATGYQDNSDWVTISDVKDKNGNFIHDEGISPVENLYFIGRSWQRTRGSSLITGVGDDAEILVQQLQQKWSQNPETALQKGA
ncbi:MAG: NAD(P)/FAD-dependent oxidoreductase [Phototrophicaceae bacterium]